MVTNDLQDFPVPFDEDILLCYSYSKLSTEFTKDYPDGWFMIRINTEVTY